MAQAEVYVCDTHALVWFLTRDSKLSEPAKTILRQAQLGDALVHIPTIVLSEFLALAVKGKVPWERLFEVLIRIGGISGFQVAPLDTQTFSRMLYIVLLSPQPRPSLELHDLSIQRQRSC